MEVIEEFNVAKSTLTQEIPLLSEYCVLFKLEKSETVRSPFVLFKHEDQPFHYTP